MTSARSSESKPPRWSWDMRSTCRRIDLAPRKVPNPDAGREHVFRAWRLKGSSTASVAMRDVDPVSLEVTKRSRGRAMDRPTTYRNGRLSPSSFSRGLASARVGGRKSIGRSTTSTSGGRNGWGPSFAGFCWDAPWMRTRIFPSRFYQRHAFSGLTVFDPFMGSGTTVGEAHKLGFAALGRDINPVAVESVRVALGPLDRRKIKRRSRNCRTASERRIRALYRSRDSRDRACDVLYYFWVMQAACPDCRHDVDLFSSYVIARNARPDKKADVQILCPSCGHIFRGLLGQQSVVCQSCGLAFDPERGTCRGQNGHLHLLRQGVRHPGCHRRNAPAVSPVRQARLEKGWRKGVSAGLARRPRSLCELFPEASGGDSARETL